MKKLFLFLCLICICFCGCSKNTSKEIIAETQVSKIDIDKIVAGEISNLENVNEIDDETIKALSVVVRTNLQNENLNNYEFTENKINENIYNLVSETSGKTISLLNEEINSKIKIDYEPQEKQEWSKEIKKADILKFLKNNKISLTSISNIKPENNETGKTTGLNMNGKFIPIETLISEFDLPSNEITHIENKLMSVKVYGKGDQKDMVFNISEAKKLAENGYSYDKILKNQNNGFKIIIK